MAGPENFWRCGACHLQRGYAAEQGKPVLYVTERCVFALRPDGLELVEVAPGIESSGIFWRGWISGP